MIAVPPKIIDLPDRYLDGLCICKGDTISLRVQFRGRPTPEVTWSVDKEIIESRKGIEIKSTDRISSFIRYDTERSNSGIYTITVKNKHGTDTANIPIRIVGEFRFCTYFNVFIKQ